jgi:hypothetical protein
MIVDGIRKGKIINGNFEAKARCRCVVWDSLILSLSDVHTQQGIVSQWVSLFISFVYIVLGPAF